LGRLFARSEKKLQSETDTQIRAFGGEVRSHGISQISREGFRAVTKAALAWHNELVGFGNVRRVTRNFNVVGPTTPRFDERSLDAPKISETGVANDDTHAVRLSRRRRPRWREKTNLDSWTAGGGNPPSQNDGIDCPTRSCAEAPLAGGETSTPTRIGRIQRLEEESNNDSQPLATSHLAGSFAGLSAPFIANCGGGMPGMPGGSSLPGAPGGAAGNCPDMAKADAIESFDFEKEFKLKPEVAAKIKAGVGAAGARRPK